MSLPVDVAKAAVTLVAPPRPGATDDEKYLWRWAVSGGLVFMAGIIASHIALACGFVTVLGFSGFASANDVGEVKQAILAMRADTIRGQLMETVRDQCSARDQKNFTAENAATQRKYGLVDEYRKVTGKDPDVPQCWELP